MDRIVKLNRGLLELQADHLRSCHEIIEAALRRHDSRVEEWYEEQRMVVDEDENREDQAEIEELYQRQKAEAGTNYPQLLRASLFSTGYGVVEHFLVTICKECQPHLRAPHLKELRGEGIIRSQLYLAKVAQVEWPTTNEWKDLTDYGVLRNALVHAQGDLSQNDRASRLEEFAKRIGSFEIAPDRSSVLLKQEFNPKFVDAIEEFGSQLQTATAGHYPTSWRHDV